MRSTQTTLVRRISRTSIQAQLFIIILAVLIVFVFSEFLLIQYSFENKYIDAELLSNTEKEKDLIFSINQENSKDSPNIAGVLYSFRNETGSISVYLEEGGGGFTLASSSSSSYYIEVRSGGIIYKIKLDSLSIDANINDTVNAYIKNASEEGFYVPYTLLINNVSYKESVNNTGGASVEGVIESIHRPDNINYIYEETAALTKGLAFLNQEKNNFISSTLDGSSLTLTYHDKENNLYYVLSSPNSEDNNVYVFTIFSLIETSSLLSIVSSYYGYIVLISLVVAILIATFISKAFSNPIRTIEREMKKLSEGDYETTAFTFKNRELSSLQENLNLIKKETKIRVTNINEQKESLASLNQELLKESDLRAVFIQRLSHELKTPLMVIAATTEAIQDGLFDEKDLSEQYAAIIEEVDKTNKIIKDIINTYKTSSKEVKLKKSRFNLTSLIKEILSPLYPMAQKKNLSIKEGLDTTVYMSADKELIGQVISNFLTNAIKYTDEGQKVEVNLLDTKASFVFEVKNYGAKIKEENLDKVWLPFFRESENVDKNSTGIGLYIVGEILTSHKLQYGIVNTPDNAVRAYFVIEK